MLYTGQVCFGTTIYPRQITKFPVARGDTHETSLVLISFQSTHILAEKSASTKANPKQNLSPCVYSVQNEYFFFAFFIGCVVAQDRRSLAASPFCGEVDRSTSLKVFERRRDEELLDEELRVEDGDVSGAADERVRVGGQRVVHVIPGERRAVPVSPPHDRAQDVGHHLAIGASSRKNSR